LAITRNKVVQEAPLSQVFTHDFWGVPGDADYGTRSYRPLVSLTYAMQARAFGNQPGYSTSSTSGLHAGAAVLLALLPDEASPRNRWAPWGAGCSPCTRRSPKPFVRRSDGRT